MQVTLSLSMRPKLQVSNQLSGFEVLFAGELREAGMRARHWHESLAVQLEIQSLWQSV
jgi:hypothetical protein